jgi:oxygen-independent coproporphyrinogen-3 oxidase
VRAGGNALAGHEWLDLDTSLSDLMMMGLRRHDGVDLELAGKRLGLDVEKYLEPALHRLRSDGLLERRGNWVKASPRGWRLLNRLTAEFAESLLGPPRG